MTGFLLLVDVDGKVCAPFCSHLPQYLPLLCGLPKSLRRTLICLIRDVVDVLLGCCCWLLWFFHIFVDEVRLEVVVRGAHQLSAVKGPS